MGFNKISEKQFNSKNLIELIDFGVLNLEFFDIEFINIDNDQESILKKLLDFLNNNSNDYSFLKGKAFIILLATLILDKCSNLYTYQKYYKLIEKNIINNKNHIVSENYGNSFLYGKSGILFSLVIFNKVHNNIEITNIIKTLLISILNDAKFYKKGLSWLPENYNNKKTTLSLNINEDIHIALRIFLKYYKNKNLEVVCNNITLNKKEKKVIINSYKNSNNIFIIKDFINMILNTENNNINTIKLPNLSNIIFQSNFSKIVTFCSKSLILKFLSNGKNNKHYDQYILLNELLKFVNYNTVHNNIFKKIINYQIVNSKLIDKTTIFLRVESEAIYYENLIFFCNTNNETLFNTLFIFNDENNFIISKYPWCRINTELMHTKSNLRHYFSKMEKLNNDFVSLLRVQRFDNELFLELTDILSREQIQFFSFFSNQPNNVENYIKKLLNEGKKISDQSLKNFLLLLIRLGILIPYKSL